MLEALRSGRGRESRYTPRHTHALRAAEEALAAATHQRAVDGQKLRHPAKLAAERDAAKA